MLAGVDARADDDVVEDRAGRLVERFGRASHDGEEILAGAGFAGLESATHVPSDDGLEQVLAEELVRRGEVGFVEAREDRSKAENAADIRDEGEFVGEVRCFEYTCSVTDFFTVQAGQTDDVGAKGHRERNARGIVGTAV